jgi:hypothetical protein
VRCVIDSLKPCGIVEVIVGSASCEGAVELDGIATTSWRLAADTKSAFRYPRIRNQS